jgi:HEAT repeat protein
VPGPALGTGNLRMGTPHGPLFCSATEVRMRTCEHCGCQVEATAAQCSHCRWWSEEILVRLLRHPEPGVRKQAAFDAGFVQRSERLIRTLAVALRDPVPAVRQQAGVQLFICGREAAAAIPELIGALGDCDLIVRRLAAASLSMIGPLARAALPSLEQLRDTDDELLRVWVGEAERSLAG